MIRVQPRPEPADFGKQVRAPGLKFLAGCPRPTQKQWSTHSYWRKILGELHAAYGGICAYSCHWIPYDTGADTVEHFKPKTLHPREAYEWNNYRLVCQLLNSRKSDDEGVIDPFLVKNGWFVIDFPTLIVRPGGNLGKKLQGMIKRTCDTLRLNDDATCLLMRQAFVTEYCLGNINYAHVEKRAPFLALEMKRQGLDSLPRIRRVMNVYPPKPKK